MSELTLEQWEQEFRREAIADKLAIFNNHMHALELGEETTAESMLEGTVLVVGACCAYASIDGQSAAAFLAAQTYDPAQSGASTYAFTFDLCGKASARLLVAADLKTPDLADLFDHPWSPFEVCGYRSVLISRLDGEPITEEEDFRLEKLVTADLLFDYGEDEIEICCSNSQVIGCFFVSVRDREPDEEQ
jgi:hypothetical protein